MYNMYILSSVTLIVVKFSPKVFNFFSPLLQAPDICRAKNIFVLSLDEIIENNIALAVFIGKYVQMYSIKFSFQLTHIFFIVLFFFFNYKSVLFKFSQIDINLILGE